MLPAYANILFPVCRENAISKVDTSDLGPSSQLASATGEGPNAAEHAEEEIKEDPQNVNG